VTSNLAKSKKRINVEDDIKETKYDMALSRLLLKTF